MKSTKIEKNLKSNYYTLTTSDPLDISVYNTNSIQIYIIHKNKPKPK